MAKLITCIDCGKSISTGASQCPHCKSKYPLGRICRICQTKFKRSDWQHLVSPTLRSDTMCKSCDEKIRSERLKESHFKCSVCGIVQSIDKKACLECGQPQPYREIRICTICDHEVFKKDAVTRYEGPVVEHFYHNYCFKMRPDLVKGRKCAVATATFGSTLAAEVIILSTFRDEVLLTNLGGKIFVKFYDATSPPVASLIEKSNFLKRIIRIFLLSPILSLIKYSNSRLQK